MTDMISSLLRSLDLVRTSAKVLRSDPELLILPALSGVATLAVGGALVWQAIGSGIIPSPEHAQPGMQPGTGFYVWMFLFYFVEYFIIIFFNTALVGAAIAKLDGGDPTIGSAIALAWGRLPAIIGYALISATVGVLLRWLADKLGFIGRLIEFGAGLAWTVATFLVVPVLAAEGVGPIKAISRSGELLNETWGENLVGRSGISVVMSLIAGIVTALGIGAGVKLVDDGANSVGISVIVVTVFVLLGIVIVSTALSAIYSGAVYYFAFTGDAPKGFDKTLIREAFGRKPPEA